MAKIKGSKKKDKKFNSQLKFLPSLSTSEGPSGSGFKNNRAMKEKCKHCEKTTQNKNYATSRISDLSSVVLLRPPPFTVLFRDCLSCRESLIFNIVSIHCNPFFSKIVCKIFQLSYLWCLVLLSRLRVRYMDPERRSTQMTSISVATSSFLRFFHDGNN